MVNDIRQHFFTWFGIIGAIITILSNGQTVLRIADWIRAILRVYADAAHWFWQQLALVIGWHVTKPVAMLLSLTAFTVSFAIGSYLKSKILRRPSIEAVLIVILPAALIPTVRMLSVADDNYFDSLILVPSYVLWLPLGSILYFFFLMYYLRDGVEGRRGNALLYTLFCALVFVVFREAFDLRGLFYQSYSYSLGTEQEVWHFLTVWLFFSVMTIPLLVTDARAVMHRAGFILVGVCMAVALSILSDAAQHWGPQFNALHPGSS